MEMEVWVIVRAHTSQRIDIGGAAQSFETGWERERHEWSLKEDTNQNKLVINKAGICLMHNIWTGMQISLS